MGESNPTLKSLPGGQYPEGGRAPGHMLHEKKNSDESICGAEQIVDFIMHVE